MLLFLTTLAVLAALALGIMAIIGLFNKRINGHVNFAVRIIRTLEMSWYNLQRAPFQIWRILKVIPQKRKLFFLKISQRLKAKKQVRQKRRRQRRQQRKITKNRSR